MYNHTSTGIIAVRVVAAVLLAMVIAEVRSIETSPLGHREICRSDVRVVAVWEFWL